MLLTGFVPFASLVDAMAGLIHFPIAQWIVGALDIRSVFWPVVHATWPLRDCVGNAWTLERVSGFRSHHEIAGFGEVSGQKSRALRTARYLGIEVGDALEMAEQVDVQTIRAERAWLAYAAAEPLIRSLSIAMSLLWGGIKTMAVSMFCSSPCGVIWGVHT